MLRRFIKVTDLIDLHEKTFLALFDFIEVLIKMNKNNNKPSKSPNKQTSNQFFRHAFHSISKAFTSTIQAIRSVNVKKLGSSSIFIITLLGSIGSAAAIFSVPEIRVFLNLDDSQETARITSSAWKEYRQESEFSLGYPNDWVIQDTKDLLDGTQLQIKPLKQEDIVEDIYISIVIQDANNSPLTLQEYQLRVTRLLETYLANSRVINQQESVVGGSPAISIEYEGDVDGSLTQFLQVAAFDRDTLFLITYSAPSTEFNRYRKTARKIMNSFKMGE